MVSGANIAEIVNDPATKLGLATRMVPLGDMVGVSQSPGRASRVGDVALAEVSRIGRYKSIESRESARLGLFEGDYLVGAFGNRNATDQFEGHVPERPVEECDVLSAGCVFGEVASGRADMAASTRLRVVGLLTDDRGEAINLRNYGLPEARGDAAGPEVILVVGSAMNSGKTTTVAAIVRSLRRSGFRAAAAKVTGISSGKDALLFRSSGADPVFDFVTAGYPSTYMLERRELLGVYESIVGNLAKEGPDYIVLKIADGILQRETRMLLDSDLVRESVDHVFFAAGDALSVAFGGDVLRNFGLPLRAASGAVAGSELGMREAEGLSGIPCLSRERIMSEELLNILAEIRENGG